MKQIVKILLAFALILAPISIVRAEDTIIGPVTVSGLTTSATPLVGGVTVTINGSGMLSINSTVLNPMNGTNATSYPITPTTQTDNQYTFRIPNSITPGTYTLQLNTNDNWGRFLRVNNQDYHFTVGLGSNAQAPKITTVSSDFGTIGSQMQIKGTGMDSEVTINFYSPTKTISNTLKVNTLSGGTIANFIIPDWLSVGLYTLTVSQPSGVSNELDFTIFANKPFITSITPDSGPAGTVVTIVGGNFSGSNTVSYNSSFDNSGSENYISSSNGGATLQFIIPTTWRVGKYNISVSNLNGSSDYKSFTVTSTNTNEKHPEGTNVLGPNGVVYRMMGNGRNPYTSAGAFTSYKFNSFKTVVPANSFDLSLPVGTYTPEGSSNTVPYYIPPRNGALIKDKGTVYIITGGLRAGFVSEKVFKDLGYSFSNVYPGDTSFMATLPPIDSASRIHPNGTLINDKGTLYVMQNGFRVGFPNLNVLDSWGYWVSDAVPANNYDRAAQQSGVLNTRMSNEMNI